MHRVLAIFTLLVLAQHADAQGRPPPPSAAFTIDGKTANTAMLVDANTDPRDIRLAEGVPMLERLAGVINTIEPRELGDLRKAARPAPPQLQPDRDPDALLILSRSEQTSTVALHLIGTGPSHDILAINGSARAVIRAETAGALRIPSSHEHPDPAAITDLEPPYAPSPITLESRTIRARVQPTDRIRATYSTRGPKRSLDEEQMWIRLPVAFDASRASPLLVWISPTPTWRIPPYFNQALDTEHVIAIGVDNTGNGRDVIDRLQLQLDAIATAKSRFNIDPNRVYLTGFSGGGRCSSILMLAFPDHIAGAIPIVGLNSHHAIQRDDGKYLPAQTKRHRGELLTLAKSRRIFAITAEADFNRPEMRARTDELLKERYQIQLEVVPDQDHSVRPDPELLRIALEYIDSPQRLAADQREEDAKARLDAYLDRYPDPTPDDENKQRVLRDICKLAPWTPPAWRAAQLLGFEPR